MGVECSSEVIQSLAQCLHCRVGELPIMYIGLPVGGKLRSKAFWNPGVEKFERKLSLLKKWYLSMGRNYSDQSLYV